MMTGDAPKYSIPSMSASGRWQSLSAGLPNRVRARSARYKTSRYLGTDLGAAVTIAASFLHTFSRRIGCASATRCRLSA